VHGASTANESNVAYVAAYTPIYPELMPVYVDVSRSAPSMDTAIVAPVTLSEMRYIVNG